MAISRPRTRAHARPRTGATARGPRTGSRRRRCARARAPARMTLSERHALAGARFADDAEASRPAARRGRRRRPRVTSPPRRKARPQVRGSRAAVSASRSVAQPRIERVAQALARDVDRRARATRMARPGKVLTHQASSSERAAVGHHRAPGRRRRLHAEAEERQAGFEDDDVRHARWSRRRSPGTGCSAGFRRSMMCRREAPIARAASTYSVLARRQRLAAHDAARDHPFLVDEREDDVLHAGPHHAPSARWRRSGRESRAGYRRRARSPRRSQPRR